MENNSIIKQSNQGIVLEETPVTLSDEKLNGMLLHTYERAVKDVSKWRFYNLYSVLLSIAGTLFLSLFTSSFNDMGQLSSNTVRTIVVVITLFSAVVGFVFLGISVNQKKNNDTDTRDSSIKEIIDKYSKQ